MDLVLKDYQKEGVKWLASRKRALLADDCGLGKTVQVIKACDELKLINILIICPSSAKHNWANEFETWSRNYSFSVKDKLSDRPSRKMVCSYNYATELFRDLGNMEWDLVCIDESHFLKCPKSKRAKNILGKEGIVHKAKRIWMLSGTPAPNDYSELWTTLYTFGMTKLGFKKFREKFCVVISTNYGTKIIGNRTEMIPELKSILKKIMFRRLKSNVIDLPPINYIDIEVKPNRIPIDVTINTEKVAILRNRIENIVNEEELLPMARSMAELRKCNVLEKLIAATNLVRDLVHKGKKVVIFGIHKEALFKLFNSFSVFNPVGITGDTPSFIRQKNIEKFQNDPECKIFIGNIVAAGTAITLTAAHEMVFIEQDWVPGNNAQAVMRCHRIGQENPVNVRILQIKDSVDDKINGILSRKTKELVALLD